MHYCLCLCSTIYYVSRALLCLKGHQKHRQSYLFLISSSSFLPFLCRNPETTALHKLIMMLWLCIYNTVLHHHHPGGQQPLTSSRTYVIIISLSLNQSSLMGSSFERKKENHHLQGQKDPKGQLCGILPPLFLFTKWELQKLLRNAQSPSAFLLLVTPACVAVPGSSEH